MEFLKRKFPFSTWPQGLFACRSGAVYLGMIVRSRTSGFGGPGRLALVEMSPLRFPFAEGKQGELCSQEDESWLLSMAPGVG